MDPATIQVVLKASGDHYKINEEDFDPDLHEKLEPKAEGGTGEASGTGTGDGGGSAPPTLLEQFEKLKEENATKAELIAWAEENKLDIGPINDPDDAKKDVLLDAISDALKATQ